MKFVLFGASGTIGSRILAEAQSRGHTVTAVSRDPSKLGDLGPGTVKTSGNVLNAADVARISAGHEAVVCAVGPDATGGNSAILVDSARTLHEGLKKANVGRLVVVGGAGSLEVAPGKLLMDSPDFPEAWRPLAAAASEALKVYRTFSDIEWTYLSPAGLIEPGAKTGSYRTGLEQLVVDENGRSYITAEDYAVALVDELEDPKHIRKRFTVAY